MRDTIAGWAISSYQFLLPIAWFVLGLCVLALPFVLFRRTRAGAGVAIVFASYVFGATTWFLGAALTFSYFGWVGLILGLCFVGIGVVPLGIWAAFFRADVPSLGWALLAMLVLTFGARIFGAVCASQNPRTEA